MHSDNRLPADLREAVALWAEADLSAGAVPLDRRGFAAALRRRLPAQLAEASDAVITDLWELYTAHRRAGWIDMDAVARAVNAAPGLHAEVVHDPDGTAMIVVGPADAWPDEDGHRRWAGTAGPGIFLHRTLRRHARARLGDFCITCDDDGDPITVRTGDGPDALTEVAQQLIRHAEDSIARRGRLDDALQDAELAFWAAIRTRFPDIESGDVSPDGVLQFAVAQRRAVSAWLRDNRAGTPVAATRAKAQQIADARASERASRIAARISSHRLSGAQISALVAEAAYLHALRHAADGFAVLDADALAEALNRWARRTAAEAARDGLAAQSLQLQRFLGEREAIRWVDAAATGTPL